jgi:hypothetical protein
MWHKEVRKYGAIYFGPLRLRESSVQNLFSFLCTMSQVIFKTPLKGMKDNNFIRKRIDKVATQFDIGRLQP